MGESCTVYVITDVRGIEDGAILETCSTLREVVGSLAGWPDDARVYRCNVEGSVSRDSQDITSDVRTTASASKTEQRLTFAAHGLGFDRQSFVRHDRGVYRLYEPTEYVCPRVRTTDLGRMWTDAADRLRSLKADRKEKRR